MRHGWELHGESAGLSVRTGLLMGPGKARYRDEANFGGSWTVRQRSLSFYSWLSTL